jgi:Mor family transcriptional regulator
MIKRSIIVLIALIGITASSFGSEDIKIVKEEDLTLQHVINRASYVTGHEYYTTENLDIKISIVNLDINRENADAIISSLLHQNNLIRVKDEGKLYKIVSSKDLKYSVVPSVKASKKIKPELPKTHDYYLLKYSVADVEGVQDLKKVINPYLSEYGKVVSANNSGEIIIKDNAKNLAKIYRVLKDAELDSSQKVISVNEREHEHHILEENVPKDT